MKKKFSATGHTPYFCIYFWKCDMCDKWLFACIDLSQELCEKRPLHHKSIS